MLNLFGGSKKAVAKKAAPSSNANFTRIQVVSKPEFFFLLKGTREEAVTAHVSRIKLKAASLVSGCGEATIQTLACTSLKVGQGPFW